MRSHAKATVAVLAMLLTLAFCAGSASAAAPVVSIDPASEIGVTTAQATGEVNPEGKETSWHFEYISDAAYSVHQDAEQTLTVAATAGAYTLSFGGQTTAAIAFSASATTVEGELNALSTIGGVGGSVSVSGGPGDESGSAPYTITFGGSLSETNVEQLSADPTGLLGSASVETTVQGRSEGFEGATEFGGGGFSLEEAEAISGSTPVPPATIEGLAPATEYHLRLVASNEDGSTEAIAATFETDTATAPSLSVNPADPVAYTTATITGEVDPEGGNSNPVGGPIPIFWQLQYAPASEPEPRNWQLGESGTIEGAEAESSDPIPVSASLTSLTPDTEYDFRLIANYAGSLEETSGEESFETLEVTAPLVTIDPITTFDATTAHLSGTVEAGNADSAFDAHWRFEYALQPDFTGAKSTLAATVSGTGAEDVEADLAQLKPNRTYYVRLVATNLGGTTESAEPDPSFATDAIAPTAITLPATKVLPADATIRARVNPNGSSTKYWLEWGTKDCSTNPCSSVPGGKDADAGSEHLPIHPREDLTGLTPATTYHFRVVAQSAAGIAEGDDLTFTTPASANNCANAGSPGVGFLPGCRAWEVVSPANKNGGGVAGDAARTRAAADGSAVTFTSMTPFGNVEGTGVASEYLATRSTDPDPGDSGWSTHGITPRQEAQTLFTAAGRAEPRYEGAFSPDLSTGVFMAWSPLTEAPNVEGVQNLYLRDDLLDPGPGFYQLLSDCPVCSEKLLPIKGNTFNPGLAGASADFSHVIFESRFARADGAPEDFELKLYEFDNGAVRFVGILPDGSSAPRSVAGHGITVRSDNFTLNPISADGSRIAFTEQESGNSLEGRLFSRINGRSTVQLNASERTVPEGSQPAKYWDASADHSRVFFTSPEPLTDDAKGLGKLYMWKRQDHDEVQQVAVDASGGSFTLNFNGNTTEAVNFNASAATLESALEELVSVKAGNVSVSGGPGSAGAATPYEVTFTGDFAGANVAEMSADGSGLSGGAASATVSTTTPVKNLSFLSVDEEPADEETIDVRGVLGASRDGKRVYFLAVGQAVLGAPASQSGIYLWHEGEISFVGEDTDFGFDFDEMVTGQSSLILNRRETRVTPDGRHLLFRTRSGEGLLSAYGKPDANHNERKQLYLYSADSDDLACISCRPDGAPSTAEATDAVREATAGSMTSRYVNHPLSDDGRYVFFTTAEKLVPEDSNGAADAYVYDNAEGKARLLSSGEDRNDSYFLDASPSGKDAFFITREQLSGWDIDDGYDLYDARVGGGFPEPPPPPPSCQGDACQPAPLVLNDPTPGSSSLTGPGDPNPRNPKPRCAKGKHRVKARNGKSRCVRKQSRKQKRANSNRRAGR